MYAGVAANTVTNTNGNTKVAGGWWVALTLACLLMMRFNLPDGAGKVEVPVLWWWLVVGVTGWYCCLP